MFPLYITAIILSSRNVELHIYVATRSFIFFHFGNYLSCRTNEKNFIRKLNRNVINQYDLLFFLQWRCSSVGKF